MLWAGFEPQTLAAASSDEDLMQLPHFKSCVLLYKYANLPWVFEGFSPTKVRGKNEKSEKNCKLMLKLEKIVLAFMTNLFHIKAFSMLPSHWERS